MRALSAYVVGVGIAYAALFALQAVGWPARRAAGSVLTPLPGAKAGPRAADLVPDYRKGVALFSRERFSEAIATLTRAARLAPDDPRPLVQMGQVYRALQYADLEADAYRKALRLDPDHHDARMHLARSLCDFGRSEEAVKLLETARKKQPKDPLVWAELALNYRRLGRPKEAIRLLLAYNAARGKQDWGYANLGRAYAELGEVEKAEAAYRVAIEANRHVELARLWLGQLLVTTGRQKEGQRVLQEFRRLRQLQTEEHMLLAALTRNSDFPPTLLRLGQVRNLLGKPEKALIALNHLLDLQPENVDGLVSVAHALTLLKRPQDALMPLRRAVDIQPENQKLRDLYEKRRRRLEQPPRGASPSRIP